jgi:hypothetical protein
MGKTPPLMEAQIIESRQSSGQLDLGLERWFLLSGGALRECE